MNFLRYKALLRLSRLSSCSAECNCESKLRFYSDDSVLTSAAPNRFFKNENDTTVTYTKHKKFNFINSNNQHVKTNNFNNNHYRNENSDPTNSYNSNFKTKNYNTKSYDTARYKKNNNAFPKYKSKSHPNYTKSINNHKTDPYMSVVDMDNYVDELVDDTFMNEEITKEKLTDNKKNRIKKFDEPSKKSQSSSKSFNYRLRDNPVYQTEIPCDEEEIETKDNLDIQYVKNLGINDESDSINEEKTFSKTNYQVYHFDPKLSEFPDDNSSDQAAINIRKKTIQSTEGIIEYDLSPDEFNINKYLKELTNVEPLEPLDTCGEDISDFGRGLEPTFNFAAYANKSELIQEYVKLGVKLYKVENDMDHMRALLSVDLKEELPIYIQFLHDCGVPANSLGDVITENPMVLKEDLDDMKTRIRYLRAHDFTLESIARIVTKNPTWLTWATKHIDERLGHFQNEFKLTGSDIRFLATKQPKLITYKFRQIHENTFAVREEMGFNREEIKVLLLSKPRLWMNSRKKIVDAFDYLHNTMKLSHLMIASQADTLTCRKSRLQNRHEFLVELNKVQYNPKKPNYISPSSLIFGSDEEFCKDIAKASIDTYNLFLKTR